MWHDAKTEEQRLQYSIGSKTRVEKDVFVDMRVIEHANLSPDIDQINLPLCVLAEKKPDHGYNYERLYCKIVEMLATTHNRSNVKRAAHCPNCPNISKLAPSVAYAFLVQFCLRLQERGWFFNYCTGLGGPTGNTQNKLKHNWVEKRHTRHTRHTQQIQHVRQWQ